MLQAFSIPSMITGVDTNACVSGLYARQSIPAIAMSEAMYLYVGVINVAASCFSTFLFEAICIRHSGISAKLQAKKKKKKRAKNHKLAQGGGS